MRKSLILSRQDARSQYSAMSFESEVGHIESILKMQPEERTNRKIVKLMVHFKKNEFL